MSVESSGNVPSPPSADARTPSESAVALASLPAGSSLGRYQIVQRIARGGMAELYTARTVAQGGFEKLVALKRILPHLGEDSAFVRMFLNEARVAAVLDHSNIAHVIDFGSAGGEHYLVMEYVHGHSVQELLRATAGRDRIPLGVGLTIVYELATALNYAHEKTAPDGRPLGLVHRDVSPSNVLLSEHGGVKLVDFGIAKATEHTRATESGVIKGKLSYMAPEQVRGEPLDRRADVFALGVVAYELTTGRKCFRAAGEFALINRVAQGRYTRPSLIDPEFPPDLEAVIAQAMAVDPDQRFPSADAFARAVARFAEGEGISMSRLGLSDYLGTVFEPKPHPETIASVPDALVVPGPTAAEPSGFGVSRRSGALALVTLVVGLGLGLVVASTTGVLSEDPPAGPSLNNARAVPDEPVVPTTQVEPSEPAAVAEAPAEAPSVDLPTTLEPEPGPDTKPKPKTRKRRRKPTESKPRAASKAPEYLPPSYR